MPVFHYLLALIALHLRMPYSLRQVFGSEEFTCNSFGKILVFNANATPPSLDVHVYDWPPKIINPVNVSRFVSFVVVSVTSLISMFDLIKYSSSRALLHSGRMLIFTFNLGFCWFFSPALLVMN